MTSPHPARAQRAYCERAIEAHRSYRERARAMLRRARTEDERQQARDFITDAERELAYWRAAREVASDAE